MSYYTVQDTSLEAIGDVIRSKLGITGDTRTVTKYIAKFGVSSTTSTWSGTGYSTHRYLNIAEEDLLSLCNNVRPTYLQIDVTLPGNQNESLYVYYQLSGWSANNHIITLPTTGDITCDYEWYHQSSYSGQYYQASIPSATFTFLDANYQPIIAKKGVTRIDRFSANNGYTYENLFSSTVVIPSTLSIDEMIELITDDLTKASN